MFESISQQHLGPLERWYSSHFRTSADRVFSLALLFLIAGICLLLLGLLASAFPYSSAEHFFFAAMDISPYLLSLLFGVAAFAFIVALLFRTTHPLLAIGLLLISAALAWTTIPQIQSKRGATRASTDYPLHVESGSTTGSFEENAGGA